MNIKHRVAGIVGLLVLALVAGCSGDPRQQFAADSGAGVDLAALDGRVLVVNYWAVWCAPCRHEIPELNELARADAAQVTVVGVNYDRVAGEQLADQVAQLGIEFPTLLRNPAEQLGHTASGVLPETLIVAPDGVLVDVLIGPQTLASLREAVAAVVK